MLRNFFDKKPLGNPDRPIKKYVSRMAPQFQKGISLPDFIRQFSKQEQRHDALFKWCWPNGFERLECGHPVPDRQPLLN